MAEKPYRWTVDVEYDFGGRTHGTFGLREGIPKILEAFSKAQIKALFFISTETLDSVPDLVQRIFAAGHEVGSHGHFHTRFKEAWRAKKDRRLSHEIIKESLINNRLYRAPKFYWDRKDSIYANPAGHMSLLKHLWLGLPIKEETIIYLHPFDITGTLEAPPNLFCWLWYSRHKQAYKLFQEMVNKYK